MSHHPPYKRESTFVGIRTIEIGIKTWLEATTRPSRMDSVALRLMPRFYVRIQDRVPGGVPGKRVFLGVRISPTLWVPARDL